MKARFLLYLLCLVTSVLQVRAYDISWDFNPYAYQYDMTVYVSLSSIEDEEVTDQTKYQIAAFCGEECRGIAETKTANEHEYLYLRVRSNKAEGEAINFIIKNRTTGQTFKAAETLIFKSQDTVGYPSSPFLVSVRSQYRVTFIIDGESQSSLLNYGDAIVPPDVPEKKGYTFNGWTPEVEATMPDHDVTYTAVYVPNRYTITFDTDGGSEIAPITQEYDSAITPPANPTKVGHTFAGWNKEIPLTMPAEDITIKALWTINQYTITFDTDGGSEITPITQDYNSAVTPPANPTKVGHTFVGWDKEIPLTMPAENITIKALWTVNQYKVSFVADGTVISEETLAYGSRIAPPEAPEKEGHTFAGWKDVPETMPAHDIEIHGSYSVNVYTLTYQVDGAVYKTYTVEYGTAIVPEAVPEKEGHTFSGWQGLPDTMPAHDVVASGTFAINSYRAVFIIGEDAIETRTIVYGQPVTTPEAPEKEGHTFAGWEDVPETMPAHDIEIHGTYNVNAYSLTYQVDGTVYKTYTVEYGTTIVPEAFPEKEGHTFSGWQGLPDTMPAHDVVVSGTFAINSYRAVFIIGEDVIETRTIVYGQPITTPEAPEKEGHTFAGWEDVPETMPAHDIEIYGTYTVNAYKLTVFLDGAIYMEEMLEYGTPITIPDPEVPEGKQFNGWMTEVPETMPAHDLEIYGTTSEKTGISSIVADEQTEVSIYDMKGNLLFKNTSSKGIPNKLSKGIYIVNGKKVLMH